MCMYERKAYKAIKSWKESLEIDRTALIISGPRQIGKTSLALEFSKNEYENIVYINFMENKKMKECFENSLKVNDIIENISILDPTVKFIDHKTVIIFDEVQECSNARLSFKPFCLDGRYDIIATGSLLGISGYSKKEDVNVPVGFETFLDMHAMDFEEFLWAYGYSKDTLNNIKASVHTLKAIDNVPHEKLLDIFKKYIIVGGMPKVVEIFLTTKNYNKARAKQQSILKTYRNDFGKHLDKNDNPITLNKEFIKICKVFDSIPTQLSRVEDVDSNKNKYTKFRFGEIDKDARFRNYADAIQWLEDSGIITVCRNLNAIDVPLKAYESDNTFKLYMSDTGLFMAMLDRNIIESIMLNTIGTYKGYIYENIIIDQLVKNNIKPYYMGDSKNEIDCVVSLNSGIYALEVKSSSGKSKSFNNLIENSNGKIKGIKLSHNNIGLYGDILYIPYYLAFMIDEDFTIPVKDKKSK